MATVHFITQPEVAVDSYMPVPDWPLSAVGVGRMRLLPDRPWVGAVRAVFGSAERKALDAARILGDRLSLAPVVIEGLGENDRSATGYLPKAEFEAVADEFFAKPAESVRGWERAADAQRRIVGAVDRALSMLPAEGDAAIVSHGGVGALINRAEDQPGEGGGDVFSFDATTRSLLSGWRRI